MSTSQKTIAIDFDGTICVKQSYGDGTIHEIPKDGASHIINKLKNEGYQVVIFTTRLNPKFGGDLAWKKEQIENWCKKYDIPFDDITNNKPEAFIYIDDRALRFTNWQDMGNYFIQ